MFTEYLDLEIQIRSLDAERYSINVSGPGGGEASSTFTLPFNDSTYNEKITRLHRLDADEDVLVGIGQTLFTALFQDRVKDVYAHSQSMLKPDQGLRLRFNIDPTDIKVAAVPWELIYDPAQGPLVLLDAPVVRYIPHPLPISPLLTELPLKVLLTAAQTPPKTDVARELNEIKSALQYAEQQGYIQIVIEEHLTPTKLRHLLHEGIHIWHFVGHGGFAADGKTACLLLEDNQGNAQRISALELGVSLNRSSVRLVVLDTCNCAKLATDPFRSVAPALIRNRIPAVLAMQFTVPEEVTRIFSSEFYRTLAEGVPIDACVTEGRKAIMHEIGLERLDWCIPVIYSRAADGQLFNLGALSSETAPNKTSLISEDSRFVDQGLIALIKLMQVSEIRTAVVAFQTNFQTTCEQIKALNHYKRLHDLFHELEICYYNLIDPDRKRLLIDQAMWNDLRIHVLEISNPIDDLLSVGKKSSGLDKSWWVQQLEQAQTDLQKAITELDRELFENAAQRLYRVIDRVPPRINTRLVEAAKVLRLPDLIEALTVVKGRLAHSRYDLVAARQITESIDALARLNSNVESQVQNHTRWQDIDDELRRVENNLSQDINELKHTWPDLKVMTQTLFGTSSEEWAVSLNRLSGELEMALTTGVVNVDDVSWRFFQYRRKASRRFLKVDDDLLDMCKDLQTIGESLDVLLRTTQ